MRRCGGHVEPGFEGVVAAFERNLAERGDKGAAFAATVDGRIVVDLWGGFADVAAGRPWAPDTLQLLFSGTKGLVALCLLVLMDRGQLDLERPVADYWPEFGACGKQSITVRDLVCHRARLPAVRESLATPDLLDPVAVAARLARQPAETDPRADFVYHALTFGWLCGELVRRIDGRSVGRFFADEVALPLRLDLWIGVPPEVEDRVSKLTLAESWGHGPVSDTALIPDDDGLFQAVWANPPLFSPELPWNLPAWHQAEIPGANAIGTARAMARLYGCLARGGELDGVRLLRPGTLEIGRRELARGRDPFADKPMRFGVGFQLQTSLAHLGPPADAFGHDGAGGSVHGAWPTERVGFSYAMNELRDDAEVDPRQRALLDALHAAVHR